MKKRRPEKRFSNIFWGRTESLFKEQRQHKRFLIELPVRLKAIAGSRTRVLDVKTKDISATGSFIYTKEASYIPNESYCQMLCMALGGDPFFNNTIDEFYTSDYFSKPLRMV